MAESPDQDTSLVRPIVKLFTAHLLTGKQEIMRDVGSSSMKDDDLGAVSVIFDSLGAARILRPAWPYLLEGCSHAPEPHLSMSLEPDSGGPVIRGSDSVI